MTCDRSFCVILVSLASDWVLRAVKWEKQIGFCRLFRLLLMLKSGRTAICEFWVMALQWRQYPNLDLMLRMKVCSNGCRWLLWTEVFPPLSSLIPYQSSPCTFSAFVFFKTLGSLLLQRRINSSSVSRRNITVVFCECVSNMSCNRTAQGCRGLEAVASWGSWYVITLKACCSSWVTFTLHQWGMWWENTFIHYKNPSSGTIKKSKSVKSYPSFINFYRNFP